MKLVERLRTDSTSPSAIEAADEIERLTKERDALRECLKARPTAGMEDGDIPEALYQWEKVAAELAGVINSLRDEPTLATVLAEDLAQGEDDADTG